MTPASNNLLLASADEGYNLTRSLRFRSSASAYLNRTFSAGNQQIMTYSGWAKLGTIGSGEFTFLNGGDGTQTNLGNDAIYIQSGIFYVVFRGGAGGNPYRQFTPVYRDPSAWYHFVVAIDTTQATAANRIKLWVNGVQVTAYTGVDPAQNASFVYLNGAYGHLIGRNNETGGPQYTDGYQAEVNFIGGQALTPSSFGSTNTLTGVWQPARYTGTYGTNGFYLPFTDNSGATATTIGKDFSGNGNYWTTNNISITAGVTYDSMTDVPTLTSATAANFAVLNPLQFAGTNGSLTSGNLTNVGGGNPTKAFSSTIAASSGKFYAEFLIVSNTYVQVAVADVSLWVGTYASGQVYGNGTVSWDAGGNQYYKNTTSATSAGVSCAPNDILQIAFDASTRKVWFGRNGTWNGSGDPAAGTNEVTSVNGTNSLVFILRAESTTAYANFGQRPFAYTPPTGFVALNTFNLPTSTIVKGNTAMNIALASGASIKTTTEALFSGQFLEWIKDRANANNHQLLDGVRGLSAVLQSNSTGAETTYLAPSGNSVGWAWKAGTSASTNTNGTITSSVSVNASAGFSVVTYTGNLTAAGNATIGHGLGVAPKMIISKSRNNASAWVAQTPFIAQNKLMYLNTTDILQDSVSLGAGTLPLPTSTTFGSSYLFGSNVSGYTYVVYCWSEIDGFSKFGSYAGNGSADGTFVYTGFRPAFVMIKGTNVVSDWVIKDYRRTNNYNPQDGNLYADLSGAEDTTASVNVDLLSNGFKLRGTYNGTNGSGYNYIFMAFAENPTKYALAR